MKYITSIIIAGALIASLSGCASLNQAYSAAGSSAVVGVRGASDNALKTNVFGLCMTPYDTIVRNPSVAPAIKDLCLPGGSKASPETILDNVPKK